MISQSPATPDQTTQCCSVMWCSKFNTVKSFAHNRFECRLSTLSRSPEVCFVSSSYSTSLIDCLKHLYFLLLSEFNAICLNYRAQIIHIPAVI